MSIAKPQLRGMFMRDMKTGFTKAFIFASVATIVYKVLFYDPRQKQYADFHKDYDMEKDFERKMKAGIFQCVDSNGKIRPIE